MIAFIEPNLAFTKQKIYHSCIFSILSKYNPPPDDTTTTMIPLLLFLPTVSIIIVLQYEPPTY